MVELQSKKTEIMDGKNHTHGMSGVQLLQHHAQYLMQGSLQQNFTIWLLFIQQISLILLTTSVWFQRMDLKIQVSKTEKTTLNAGGNQVEDKLILEENIMQIGLHHLIATMVRV